MAEPQSPPNLRLALGERRGSRPEPINRTASPSQPLVASTSGGAISASGASGEGSAGDGRQIRKDREEPIDPAQVREDMAKCPLWILAKLTREIEAGMQLRRMLDERDAEVVRLVEELGARDAEIAKKNAEISRFATLIMRLREREKKGEQGASEESPRLSGERTPLSGVKSGGRNESPIPGRPDGSPAAVIARTPSSPTRAASPRAASASEPPRPQGMPIEKEKGRDALRDSSGRRDRGETLPPPAEEEKSEKSERRITVSKKNLMPFLKKRTGAESKSFAKGPIFVHPTQDEYDADLPNRTKDAPELGYSISLLAYWVDLDDRIRFFGKALLLSSFRLFHAVSQAVDAQREDQDNLAQSAYLFFQQYDLAFDLLKAEFSGEVATIKDRTDAAFILRHSTMATKLLTVCNKTLGSAYFVKVLGPLIQRILNDPRLRDNDKNKPDDCSDLSIELILSVCTEIFDAISSSLDDIPLQLRLICRDLVAELAKRFPEDEETLKMKISGSFYFLRFICPAMNIPQTCGIAQDVTPVRRVLTLVTKLLQQLANGLPFKNEEAMARFNPFIIANSERMRRFLQQTLLAKDPYRPIQNARGFPISLSLKGIIDILSRHVPAVVEQLKDNKEQYTGKFYVLSYRYVCSLAKAMLGNTDPRIDGKVLRAAATRALGDPLISLNILKLVFGQATANDVPLRDTLVKAIVQIAECLGRSVDLLENMIKSQPVFGTVDLKRVFAQYARLIAVKSVRASLTPVVTPIIQNNTLLEIDADRLLPEQKELLTGNTQKLAELAVRVQDALEADLSKLPPEVHRIVNFFRGNSVNPTFSTTVSFLYGSIFCPALEAPEEWLGVKEVQRQAKRTLSLVSNLLMSFALNQQNFESTSINSLVQAQSSKASTAIEQWLDRPAAAVPNAGDSGAVSSTTEALKSVFSFITVPATKASFKELCASRKTPEEIVAVSYVETKEELASPRLKD